MSYKTAVYFQRAMQFDSNLCVSVNRTSQYRIVRWTFRLVSRLGDGIFWYATMLGIYLNQGDAGIIPIVHMSAAVLTGTLIYKWIKGKTLRPRPYEVRQDIWLTGRPLDRFSFPSGHTLHAVTFCMVALFYYPALSILLTPFTLLVGMSRVILGLHYPSDVLAGALIGGAIASMSIAIMA